MEIGRHVAHYDDTTGDTGEIRNRENDYGASISGDLQDVAKQMTLYASYVWRLYRLPICRSAMEHVFIKSIL